MLNFFYQYVFGYLPQGGYYPSANIGIFFELNHMETGQMLKTRKKCAKFVPTLSPSIKSWLKQSLLTDGGWTS